MDWVEVGRLRMRAKVDDGEGEVRERVELRAIATF